MKPHDDASTIQVRTKVKNKLKGQNKKVEFWIGLKKKKRNPYLYLKSLTVPCKATHYIYTFIYTVYNITHIFHFHQENKFFPLKVLS